MSKLASLQTEPAFLTVLLNALTPMEEMWPAMLEEAERLPYSHHILRRVVELPSIRDLRSCTGVVAPVFYPEMADCLGAMTYPVINTSNTLGRVSGMGNILSDDVLVGECAGRHLIERGHRLVLSVGHSNVSNRSSAERREGLRRVVEAAGGAVKEIDFPRVHFDQSKREWSPLSDLRKQGEILYPILKDLPPDAAIFGVNAFVVQRLREIIQKLVPDKADTLGLLGVDRPTANWWMHGIHGEVSAILPDFARIGVEAIRWVHRHGRDKEAVQALDLRIAPQGVLEGSSTAGQACAHPLVARGVRWSWQQVRCGESPTVKDVAQHLRMSTRTLNRLYDKHLGMSPRDNLIKIRIDRACQMLRENRFSIGDISSHCGFSKQGAFSRAFRDVTGMNPRDWRRQAMDNAANVKALFVSRSEGGGPMALR